MGYKLAGFHHLGGVEIDPTLVDLYERNHSPQYIYHQDIRDFNDRQDLPDELFNLDLLDGSPPCSSFSSAGARERFWGVERKFREGQTDQTLDDLAMVFVQTIAKLKPRICLLENVEGLIHGNAKMYAQEIYDGIRAAGYRVQLFRLNSATMGVPQRRKRVFFIGLRNDIDRPPLRFQFSEPPIVYGKIRTNAVGPELTPETTDIWQKRRPGDLNFHHIHSRISGKNKRFSLKFVFDDLVAPVLLAGNDSRPVRWDSPHRIPDEELFYITSWPQDYDFGDQNPQYVMGMSVPPVMMAMIAAEIKKQWIDGTYGTGKKVL